MVNTVGQMAISCREGSRRPDSRARAFLHEAILPRFALARGELGIPVRLDTLPLVRLGIMRVSDARSKVTTLAAEIPYRGRWVTEQQGPEILGFIFNPSDRSLATPHIEY